MTRMFPVFCCVVIILISGCNNKEDKTYQDGAEMAWFDYQVSAQEGDDKLTVMLQFLDGGKNGNGIAMNKVMLDGEAVPADSTKMGGVFYELHKPILAFTGKHTIVVTGFDNKEYKEEFDFKPLGLATPFADTVRRGELTLNVEGLEKEDHLRVLMTDTSFINNGINKLVPVVNGGLSINRSDLEDLANGPVQLELIREYERAIKNEAKRRGRLQINYVLKREFFLAD